MTKKPTYVLHCHHDVLFERLTEPVENRIKYIKENKPKDEIETRLRLMRVLTDEEVAMMPKEGWKAWKARDKAWKAQDKTRKAWKAWDKQSSPVIMAWHEKVCGCKEWQHGCLIFSKK